MAELDSSDSGGGGDEEKDDDDDVSSEDDIAFLKLVLSKNIQSNSVTL